jgi:hypothetical protein
MAKANANAYIKTRQIHLCENIVFNTNDARHQVMVSTKVFRPRMIHDVRPELQRPLQIRRHHGVVNNNQGIWATLAYE